MPNCMVRRLRCKWDCMSSWATAQENSSNRYTDIWSIDTLPIRLVTSSCTGWWRPLQLQYWLCQEPNDWRKGTLQWCMQTQTQTRHMRWQSCCNSRGGVLELRFRHEFKVTLAPSKITTVWQSAHKINVRLIPILTSNCVITCSMQKQRPWEWG